MPNLNRNLFYDSLEELLQISNLDEKFAKFREFYSAFKEGKFNNFQRMTPPKPLFEPSYKQICNIVPIKQSSKIKSKNKEALFLHNIAHIEYSAIEIALDACYRFEMMPREFYSDWLEVASDEIRHFCMIESCLCKSGFRYGDFAVHDGLFVALKKTENSLIERMALLPRFMEANGLDANKFIIERLKKEGKEEIIALLEVEYFDELYTFEKDSLKSFIENIDDNLKSIAIVGHNNAITAVCEELSDSAIGNLPTCGIFAIRFDVTSFKELFEKEGEILYYCYPKMFKKE